MRPHLLLLSAFRVFSFCCDATLTALFDNCRDINRNQVRDREAFNIMITAGGKIKVKLPDLRSTKRFELHIAPEARERLESVCKAKGVPMSHWISDLILGRETEGFPGIELAPLARLSELVVSALETLDSKDAATRKTLMDARNFIGDTLYANSDLYEQGMDRRVQGAATAWRG